SACASQYVYSCVRGFGHASLRAPIAGEPERTHLPVQIRPLDPQRLRRVADPAAMPREHRRDGVALETGAGLPDRTGVAERGSGGGEAVVREQVVIRNVVGPDDADVRGAQEAFRLGAFGRRTAEVQNERHRGLRTAACGLGDAAAAWRASDPVAATKWPSPFRSISNATDPSARYVSRRSGRPRCCVSNATLESRVPS